jgi:LacI family transcriptional regulator
MDKPPIFARLFNQLEWQRIRNNSQMTLTDSSLWSLLVNGFTKALYHVAGFHVLPDQIEMLNSMKPKRATVRDVADQAAVSVATVSRWLNGSIKLPEVTAERIRRAVILLRYEPNLHARRLSLGRTDTLALVVPDIADPFFAMLAGSVEAAAESLGFGIVLCATLNRPTREVDYIGRVYRNHVDGLLFATNHPDDGTLLAAMQGQSNVVLLDEDVQGVNAPKVFCDNHSGGQQATAHLIAAGHRRIGFVGGVEGVMSAVERCKGYASALQAESISFDPALTDFGGYTAEQGRSAARRLLQLQKPPTAIFASSDQIAIGVLEVLREAGMSVPGDMSIVAYDDVAPFSFFLPAMTAIRQPVAEMGRRGVERLVGHLTNTSMDKLEERLPVHLIQRGSVAPPASPSRLSRLIKAWSK